MKQQSLLSKESKSQEKSGLKPPLAHFTRPQDLESFVGQNHLYSQFPFLKKREGHLPALILWGPSGTGKTTLAHILANEFQFQLHTFNAVLGGLPDLRKLIQKIFDEQENEAHQKNILFIDEIHRFNKAQQDALLPYVEKGDFILIGATTENPRVSVNRALLSRMQILELKKLTHEEILLILKKSLEKIQKNTNDEIINYVALTSDGDARKALNFLEIIIKAKLEEAPLDKIKKLIQNNVRLFDKTGDRHYDVISAFIKSMRGSDPDAAILWLAIMIDGGEDPVFIARRLVIFASEDIGNADPRALSLATSALMAVQNIGMPEARIVLGQTVSYLASTVKSNASYKAIDHAIKYVQERDTIEVPMHLRNLAPEKKDYLYPHNFPKNFVKQKYTNEMIPKFYKPTDEGQEKFLRERLQSLWE